MGLTYQEVSEILKVIDASGCDEVVLEIDGTRLAVRRSIAGAPASATTTVQAALPSASASATPAPSPLSAAPAPASAANGSAAPEPAPPGTLDVRAPMIGTFYRRPSPQEPMFVEVGHAVTKGQPLCLIEVMKLFTTIEATAAGTIDAILPEDGALVEFDQLLFAFGRDDR